MGAADHGLGAVKAVLAVSLTIGLSIGVLVSCGGDGDGASDGAGTTTTTTAADAATPARDFSRPGIVNIAHRGASASAPEHTTAAYTLAIDQGADYIEQDVQLTEDGQLVVLHDPSLDRTARGPAEQCTGFVSEKTVQELAACDVGTWFNEANPELADPSFARQRIPLLSDVLQDYGGLTRFYIEVKAPDDQPGMVDALLEVLDEDGPSDPDVVLPPVVIQSFSAASLQQIHQERPELPLVQLIRQGQPAPVAQALDDIATYAVAIGIPKELVTRDLVELAAERCLAVHPYTVDDEAEMGSMLDAQVSGMFTNAPGVLEDLLPEAPLDRGLCPASATADA